MRRARCLDDGRYRERDLVFLGILQLPLFTRFRDMSPSRALVTAHYTLCA